MRGLWTIYRRELAGLFLSPLAWTLLTIALFVEGLLFVTWLDVTGRDLRVAMILQLAGTASTFLAMVLTPLLTMRMISEEARSGLLEFLLTAPVSDLAIVLGKLGAVTTFMLVLWSSTLSYGLIAQMLGVAPDWIPSISAVFGATLLSALFCSIGLAASALTNVPIVAAFLAFVANLTLFLIQAIDQLLKLPPGHWAKSALGHANLTGQFSASFGSGVLDSKHVLSFLIWTAFFVFVATRLLEKRRWS